MIDSESSSEMSKRILYACVSMTDGTETTRVNFYRLMTIEADSHPLIRDRSNQSVISMVPEARHSNNGKSMSYGALNYMVDEATSILATALDSSLRSNVTVTLDFKVIEPVAIDQRFYMLYRVDKLVNDLVNMPFSIHDAKGKMLAYGSHLKSYVGIPFRDTPLREKL